MAVARKRTSRIDRLQRWGVPALAAMVGLSLTAWIWQALETRDRQIKEEAFRAHAEIRVQALQQAIGDAKGVASGLVAYFAGSELVEAWEWPAFGGPLLSRYEASIVSLQWVPRVWAHAEPQVREQWVPRPHYPLTREDHEAVLAAETAAPQPIRELAADGRGLVIAAAREHHFPLAYQVTRGDRWQCGFDWWSNAIAREAMRRAVETGEATLSGRLDRTTRHAVTAETQDVALIVEPVFFKAGGIERLKSAQQRWAALRGFVVVALRPGDAVEQAMAHLPVTGIDLHIFDVSAEAAPTLLDFIPSRLHREPIEPFIEPGQPPSVSPYEVLEVTFGGRQVRVYATPTEPFLAMHRSWTPELALGSGVLASGLLAGLLLSLITHTQRARWEATERRAHAQQQAAVAQLGLAGLRQPSISDLMDQALELVVGTLELPLASVLELDPDRGRLRLVAGKGWPAEAIGRFELDADPESLAGYSLLAAKPIVVDDLARETRFRAPVLERHGVISGVSTLIVSNNGEPCGVLGAYDRRRREFTDDDINFLQAIANVLGHVIVQQRTEAELRESEERFRTMADATPSFVWLCDANKQCTYFNKAWLAFTGRSMDKEVGFGWTENVHGEDCEGFLRAFETAFDRREPFRLQYRLRRADGDYRWVIDQGVPRFTPDGAFVGYIGAAIDVTDQKEAEQQLQSLNETLERRVVARTAALEQANEQLRSTAAALERSNRELEQFAYIASHDLQEPLRKVRGFGQMLRESVGRKMDAQSQDFLDRIEAATRRMDDLIEGLLTYSRVTTQRRPFGLVDLREVAEEVVSDLELRIQETGGEVELGELPATCADRLQMRQLLQNLIANALKFHKPDEPPRVRVYARHEAPNDAESANQGRHQLFVEDNGIGIDPEAVDQLFTPFYRLHGHTSPYAGAGIGLAVCRKIVERHGGSIGVRSRPGQGATFIVTLPARPREACDDREREACTDFS